MDTVLVTGATGNTGSALVETLVGRGVTVRAMVRRDADRDRFPGTETVVADLDDPDTLGAALRGVDRAYLVTPSSERAQEQQLRFAEQAAAAGVGHVVKLSQFAAVEDSPVRFLRYHATVERRIRELGLDWTFLRPNLFFQGLFAFADTIRSDGRFFAPIADARISAVDVRDIADVAAVALTEPGHLGRTYTLTGPAAVTHAEMAAAIAAVAGRPVSFVDVTPEAFAAALQGLLPEWQLGGLVEDYAHYARGEAAEVSSAVRDVTGHAPRGLTEFAHDHRSVFAAGGV